MDLAKLAAVLYTQGFIDGSVLDSLEFGSGEPTSGSLPPRFEKPRRAEQAADYVAASLDHESHGTSGPPFPLSGSGGAPKTGRSRSRSRVELRTRLRCPRWGQNRAQNDALTATSTYPGLRCWWSVCPVVWSTTALRRHSTYCSLRIRAIRSARG
jgi:hypothetical protein